MEDIARLSKEANLAYYEMVICKYTNTQIHFANTQIHKYTLQIHKYTNTLCNYTERDQIVVVKGKGHLFAPGLVHCAVWSPQHQRGPHEAETGRSLFILYVQLCILNFTLIFILVLSCIQIFTFLCSSYNYQFIQVKYFKPQLEDMYKRID